MQHEKPAVPKGPPSSSSGTLTRPTGQQGSSLHTPLVQKQGSTLKQPDVAVKNSGAPVAADERRPASEFPSTRIGPKPLATPRDAGKPSGSVAPAPKLQPHAKALTDDESDREMEDHSIEPESAGGNDKDSIKMTHIRPQKPAVLSDVVRNAEGRQINFVRARDLPPSTFAALRGSIQSKLSVIARLGLKSVNGVKTNKFAIGPVATADVSIQLPMSKEQSFNELRDTRIPLPKREPTYAVMRNPRQDMKQFLERIHAKHQALTASEAARTPAVAAPAGTAPGPSTAVVSTAPPALPLAAPGPITPVTGMIDKAKHVAGEIVNRDKFMATPGIGKYVAANPGKLEAARADHMSAAALALNKASDDLKLAIAARNKLDLLPEREGKGKERQVLPRVEADGSRPLARRPGLIPATPEEKRADITRADEIVTAMQARVGKLQQGLTHAMREANRTAIERLDDFDAGKPEDRRALSQLLQDYSDRAFVREESAATRSTMPRHELDAVMEALRGGVKQGTAIDPAHAVEVMREMRDTRIDDLVANMTASGLTDNQKRINKVMSRLGESPYGIHMIKALAQPQAEPGSKAVATPQAAKAQKIADGIRAEALRTLLSQERLKEDLDPRAGVSTLASTQISLSQNAALARYQHPHEQLDPAAQSHYNLARNGLIGREGNLQKLNQVAEVLKDFKTNLEAQARGPNQVRPNGIYQGLKAAALGVPAVIADRGQFMAAKKEYLTKLLDDTVMKYVPVSVINPSSLNAFNKTASSYSADVTAKTVVRLDAYLMDLRGKLEQATSDHIEAATRTPITAAQRQRYVDMLADVAAGRVAKDFIADAKNVAARGADAENIRPEHLEIQDLGRARGPSPAELEIRRQLGQLCAQLNVDNVDRTAGEVPDLEEVIEAAAARAIPAGGRFPLNRDELFGQVDALDTERRAQGPGAAGDQAQAKADASLRAAQAARQKFIDTMPAPPIDTVTYDAARDMLHTFVQQAELRNKFRVTSVKLAEVNLKPPSAAFAKAFVDKELSNKANHATFGPGFKVRGERAYGNSQFIEAAYTLDGFEITIGTEQRTTGAVGGTFSMTGGFTGPGATAKGMGQIESSEVVETIRHTGVKLSVARSTIGEYDDEQVRAGENRKLVESLLPDPADDVSSTHNPTAHIMKIMSDCPHITVNLIDESFDNNNRVENAGSVGAFGKVAVLAGTALAGGQRNDTSRRTRLLDASGSLRTSRASEGEGVSLQRIAGVSTSLAASFTKPTATLGFSLASASQLKQLEGTAKEHKYKFVTENLLTLPANSRDEYEFSRKEGFNDYINNNYEAVVSHTINTRYTAGYDHLDEFEKRQCAVEDIEALRQTVETLEGDDDNLILRNVIAVSNRITDAAAREHDVIRGEQAVLAQKRQRLTPGSPADNAAADREAVTWQSLEALARDADSFTCHRLTGSERTSYQETVSLDYFGKAAVLNQSDAQRALFSFPQ
jgi:hypothetical protein